MYDFPKRMLVINSGGNAPGVGRCVIDIAQIAAMHGCEVIGARYAATRLMNRQLDCYEIEQSMRNVDYFNHPLSDYFVRVSPDFIHNDEIYERSGTFLGSCTKGKAATADQLNNLKINIERLGIDGIVVIGGDGSMKIFAQQFKEMDLDIPLVFAGKTIDNDLPYIDFSLGFWSAVQHNGREIHNIMTTAADHNGIFIIEIMGRNCPELALHSALAAYDKNGNPFVDMVLGVDPDSHYNLQTIEAVLRSRHNRRAPVTGLGPYAVILIAEGATDIKNRSLDHGSKADNTYVAGHPAQYFEKLLKRKMPEDVLAPYLNGIRVKEIGHSQRAAIICDRDKSLSYSIAEHVVETFRQGLTHQVVIHERNNFSLMDLGEYRHLGHQFDQNGHARAMARQKRISFGNEGPRYWEEWQPLHSKNDHVLVA